MQRASNTKEGRLRWGFWGPIGALHILVVLEPVSNSISKQSGFRYEWQHGGGAKPVENKSSRGWDGRFTELGAGHRHTRCPIGIAIGLPRQEQRSQRRRAPSVIQSLAVKTVNRLQQLKDLAESEDPETFEKTLDHELQLAALADFLSGLPLERLDSKHIFQVVELAAICRRTRDQCAKWAVL